MRANIGSMRQQLRAIFVAGAMFIGLLIAPPATAIQGGQLATNDGVVVALVASRTAIRSFCSGALLQPRLVVTAAHCVIQNGSVINYPNGLFITAPGADLNRDNIATRARVTEVNWVRGYQNRSENIEPNDFAVLTLDKPLATPVLTRVATAAEIRSLQTNRDPVTHLGYGKLALNQDNDGIPRKLELRVRPAVLSFSYPAGSFIQTTGTSTEAICPGDSGGPIVARISNELVLVGVNAGGDTSCIGSYRGTNVATGMVASYYQSIIDQGAAAVADSTPSEPAEVNYRIDGANLVVNWKTPTGQSAAITGYRLDEVQENKRAFLGVFVADATGGGVLITNVIPETPADYAKIEALDVVLAVGGVSVPTTDAMLVELRKKSPGELVTFRVRKSSGDVVNLEVRLSETGDPIGTTKLCETTTATLTCTVPTKPGKTKYRLYALSSRGDGTAYEFVVEIGPGGPPTNIKVEPGAKSITVSWSDPVRLSSVPKDQTRVKVINTANDAVLCDVPLTAGGCQIETSAGEYRLAIFADTPVGRSERIELAAVSVLAGNPAPPTKVRIVKVAGKANYQVSWQKPTDDGGSAISGYRLTTNSGVSLCRVTGNSTKCTLKQSSVKSGAKLKLVAVNTVGESRAVTITVPR